MIGLGLSGQLAGTAHSKESEDFEFVPFAAISSKFMLPLTLFETCFCTPFGHIYDWRVKPKSERTSSGERPTGECSRLALGAAGLGPGLTSAAGRCMS